MTTTTKFWVSGAVEQTPAFSKKTLYVVGEPPLDEILSKAKHEQVAHIYMGAANTFNGSSYWDKTITELLDRGIWVTLAYNAHEHSKVLELLNPGIWQSRLFVPLLSVKIPKIETSNSNLTVKIDDVGFNETNAGVWCMHFTEVTDSNRFTDWIEFSDETLYGVASQPASGLRPAQVVQEPEVIAEGVETTMNNVLAGLDLSEVSALKMKPQKDTIEKIKTPVDAANAYAEGAKVDPLGKEESRKPKDKK